MSLLAHAYVAAVVVFTLGQVKAGDVVVQLSVNRPYNDVSDKFVSFTIAPGDLYKALDGPNRKALTRMANMLGDSYVRFVGEYNFVENAEMRLRNPTKVIWKGFNRWTRAVNWTMIIPVPYSPESWDPMTSLKILNSSHMAGITDCIWQLGTDFGSSHAQSYVEDLRTLKLMSDSYKQFVDDWKIMGADVSPGSSADEARRYIEMSKDLNAAFGWLQPKDLTPSSGLGSYINDNDPALHAMLGKKVPVWLTLQQRTLNTKDIKQKRGSMRNTIEEMRDAMRWAKTLGDAASSGFDAVFQRINSADLERPSFTFYVTALFKKVMGSRVFPARPLTMFSHSNKLYSHCANTVSGGLAFMVVNSEEEPLQVSIRSLTSLAGKEVWQYTLTAGKTSVYLNNERLGLNSTLQPQIKTKSSSKPLQLSTPGMSVSFWVLPNVDLEHCHYTEVEMGELELEQGQDWNSTQNIDKGYTSSHRLLRQMIQESAASTNIFAKAINRQRRYATFASRPKRFILEDSEPAEKAPTLAKLFEPFGAASTAAKADDDRALWRRDNDVSERRKTALEWLKELMEHGMTSVTGSESRTLLKREARSAEDYFDSLFGGRNGKDDDRSLDTRPAKKSDLKKSEKQSRLLFDADDFDEEEFFKKIEERQEPQYPRLPEGDVHLRHITNAEGEELDDLREEKKNMMMLRKKQKRPVVTNEMKPLRLLPSEFYEGLSISNLQPAKPKMNMGSTLNSLLFPEPFSKKVNAKPSKKILGKSHVTKHIDSEPKQDSEEETDANRLDEDPKYAEDFLAVQKELRKAFLTMTNEKEEEDIDNQDSNNSESDKKSTETKDEREKLLDFLTDRLTNYFGVKDKPSKPKNHENDSSSKGRELEEVPWWDSDKLKMRPRRALNMQVPESVWHDNLIDKDHDLEPLGAEAPEHVAMYEYRVKETVNHDNAQHENAQHDKTQHDNAVNIAESSTGDNMAVDNKRIPQTIVSTVKQNVSKVVDIVTRHVSEWYNTLAKHVDFESTTMSNSVRKDTPSAASTNRI